MQIQNLSIGLDLGGTKIEVIVLSSDGTTLLRERVPTPAKLDYKTEKEQYLAIIGAIKRLIHNCEEKLNYSFRAIGICIPGAVTQSKKLEKTPNTTFLIGQLFQQALESA